MSADKIEKTAGTAARGATKGLSEYAQRLLTPEQQERREQLGLLVAMSLSLSDLEGASS